MPPERIREIRRVQVARHPERREIVLSSDYALLLPGQGNPKEVIDAAKGLYNRHVFVRQWYQEADSILQQLNEKEESEKYKFKLPLINLTGEDLKRTMNVQPAIYVATLAAWEAFKRDRGDKFVSPKMVLGFSFGMFAAAAISRVFSKESGLIASGTRGKAYQWECDKQPTGMVAVLGEIGDRKEEIFNRFPELYMCLINEESNIAIGGPASTLQQFAKDKAFQTSVGIEGVRTLDVNGAFHSKNVAGARAMVEKILSEIEAQDAEVDFLMRKGILTKDAGTILYELADQTDTVFDWLTMKNFLIKQGLTQTVELNGKSVTKMSFRNLKGVYEEVKSKVDNTLIGFRWKLSPPQPATA